MADASYAVVNSAALPAYYAWFRDRLGDLGIVKWDSRFDCDNFARLYCDLMAARFYNAAFESGTVPKAESPAVACFWFTSATAGPHAVVAIMTEQGLWFIEPQTGYRLDLSQNEIASHFRIIA